MAQDTGAKIAGLESRRPFSVAAARDVVFLVAIYLYFAGFVYRVFFAETFGIPAVTDTPVYSYMIFAYDAVAPNLGWFAALMLALFAFDTWIGVLSRKERRTRLETVAVGSEAALFAVVAILLFPMLFYCAQGAALADAKAIRCGVLSTATRAVIDFKPGKAAGYDADFVAAVPLGAVYLLARTDDAYYVLYQPDTPSPVPSNRTATNAAADAGRGCGYRSAARTYQIPKTDVEHVMTIAPTVYR